MPKQSLAPIIGTHVRLRLLTAADLPLTRVWRNQDHIRTWFLSSAVITAEQHAAWFRAYTQKDSDFVFIIEETHDLRKDLHKPVGQIALYNIDWERGRAEYGRLLIGEPGAARRGLAKEATQLLLAYSFQQFGLKEVRLEVLSHNAAAIALYRTCGFQQTAIHNGVISMRITPTNSGHER